MKAQSSSLSSRQLIRSWPVLAVILLGALTVSVKAQEAVVISGDVTPSPATSPTWDVPENILTVGGNSSGSMVITAGGSVDVLFSQIGNLAIGSVDISGGSFYSHQTQIGLSGTGTLSVSNGGSMTSNQITAGDYQYSLGTITVSGGLLSGTSLYIGNAGTGTLSINGSGVVYNTHGTILGLSSNGNGTISLGAGGELQTSNITRGDGAATITINGGTLTLLETQSSFLTGFSAGSVTFGSQGATLNNAVAIASNFGFSGSGGLTKTGTGSLTLSGSNTFKGTSVHNGTLIITGTVAHASDDTYVGEHSGNNATLEISGDGHLSNTLGFIGSEAGSTGSVKVAGGKWTNSSVFYVAHTGTGSLQITGTGSVSNTLAFVGFSAGSKGTVTASGGSWTSSSILYVGQEGNGTLQISGSAAITASSVRLGYSEGGQGTLTLTGGTLTTGQISKGAGSANISINGATLRATANQNTYLNGFSASDITLGANGLTFDAQSFTIAISHNFAGTGGFAKRGSGTLTLSGTQAYSGATTLHEGTLLLNGSLSSSAITVKNGGVLGGSFTLGSSLHFDAGAKLALGTSISASNEEVSFSFANFHVSDIQGLTSSTENNTYTLLSGDADYNFAGLKNVGEAEAYLLGGGVSAYFITSQSSLDLVVIPEASTFSLLGLTGLLFGLRKRFRKQT